MTNIELYALRDDLVTLLRHVESEGPLMYVLTGNFLRAEFESEARVFEAGACIPNLGVVSLDESEACEEYLVYAVDKTVNLRVVGKNGERVCIDQLANPESVTFTPGGLRNDGLVLEGRIATASDSQYSQVLMKRFHAAVTQVFSKAGSCYVGEQALVMLHDGKRFTRNAQSSISYDLAHINAAYQVSSRSNTRLSFENSYRLLQRLNYLSTFDDAAIPSLPELRPQFDDEGLHGIRFFRTFRKDGQLMNLALPRTYIGKSEFQSVSFANTDLHESTFCWNDFNSVNFTDADLSHCDLRASIFRESSFVRANLRNADLRRSNFRECDFTDADMRGVKLTRKQGERLSLSHQQKAEIDWQENDGEQPPGG